MSGYDETISLFFNFLLLIFMIVLLVLYDKYGEEIIRTYSYYVLDKLIPLVS